MEHWAKIFWVRVEQVGDRDEAAANHGWNYARWANGPPSDPNFFPIGVWLQNPQNADRYREAGINVYVGLWQGPTEAQLTRLAEANMHVICSQNDVGLNGEHNDPIIGWMQTDEPDNAQPRENGEGYGPPIKPSVIVNRYERMQKRDPTRPIFLNLGQGVAYDNYIGRGVRRGHLEDYPEYAKGADIVFRVRRAFVSAWAVNASRPRIGRMPETAIGVRDLPRSGHLFQPMP